MLVYLGLFCDKDQAVKSPCDIWPHQDVPTVFLTSGHPMVSSMSGSNHLHDTNILHSTSCGTHLPSPISPTTQPTPVISPVASYSAHWQPVFPQLQWCDIAPIKGFVHEVLRCSRTSGLVLQTALCYLEAMDLVRKEKQAFSSPSPVASDDGRISQGEVGIDYDTLLNHHLPTVYSLPYVSIRLRTMLILHSQWNRVSMLTNCWHTS